VDQIVIKIFAEIISKLKLVKLKSYKNS